MNCPLVAGKKKDGETAWGLAGRGQSSFFMSCPLSAFRNTATRWKGSVSEASRCLATPGESSWTTKYTTTVPLPKELLANHRADTLLVSRGYRDCDGYYRSTSPAEARERRQGGRIDGVV